MRQILCFFGWHKWSKIGRVPAKGSNNNIVILAILETFLTGEAEHILYECECCKQQKKLYI